MQKIKDKKVNTDIGSIEIGTLNCLEIALMVYTDYLDKMKPPVYRIVPFDEWLKWNIEREKSKV